MILVDDVSLFMNPNLTYDLKIGNPLELSYIEGRKRTKQEEHFDLIIEKMILENNLLKVTFKEVTKKIWVPIGKYFLFTFNEITEEEYEKLDKLKELE